MNLQPQAFFLACVLRQTSRVSGDVKNGCVEILFSQPEALLSDTGRNILKCETYQRKAAAVIIDEVNCTENWYNMFLWS